MVEVLNIPLYEYNIQKAVNEVENICLQSNSPKINRCISATGASGMVYARQHKSFETILRSFYMNLPDGMPAVWIARGKGAKEMQRCYGPDFFKELMISSADKPLNHYLCGGNTGIAERLKANCSIFFGNKNVLGTYTPPFREMSEKELQDLGNNVNSLNTDIVWIGISTPKQEKLAVKLKEYINVHFIITVGAAFDFHTGSIKQAPKWIQHSGFEWLFRLIQEPRRLYKRYFTIVPLFIYYNLKDILKGKI